MQISFFELWFCYITYKNYKILAPFSIKIFLTCSKLSWSLAHSRADLMSAPWRIKFLTISFSPCIAKLSNTVAEIVSAVALLVLEELTSAPFLISVFAISIWLCWISSIRSSYLLLLVSMPLSMSVSITLAYPNWDDASYKKRIYFEKEDIFHWNLTFILQYCKNVLCKQD